MAQTFDKKAYQKEYMARVYENAKRFDDLWEIFKSHGKEINKIVNDAEAATLSKMWKEVEKT